MNSMRNRSANLLASLMWFVRSAAIVGHMTCLESSRARLSPIKTNIFFHLVFTISKVTKYLTLKLTLNKLTYHSFPLKKCRFDFLWNEAWHTRGQRPPTVWLLPGRWQLPVFPQHYLSIYQTSFGWFSQHSVDINETKYLLHPPPMHDTQGIE